LFILYQQFNHAKEDAGVEAIHVGIRDEPSNDGEQESSTQQVCCGGCRARVVKMYDIHEI